MARAIAAKDMHSAGAHPAPFHLRPGARPGLGNMLLCAALLAFFPALVLKKGYACDDVILVAAALRRSSWRCAPCARRWRCCCRRPASSRSWPASAPYPALSPSLATLALLLAFGPDRLAGRHSAGRAGDPGPRAHAWRATGRRAPCADSRHHLHSHLQAAQDAGAAAGCHRARWKPMPMSRVLVADNDAEGHAGLDLCHAHGGYRWPLTAVIAAQARHRPGAQHPDRKRAEDRRASSSP